MGKNCCLTFMVEAEILCHLHSSTDGKSQSGFELSSYVGQIQVLFSLLFAVSDEDITSCSINH